MPTHLGIRIQDYYNLTPSLDNTAGDIWSGLPTFGMLGTRPLPGIIITPACDLSNRKVETITYLPIISVRSYFTTVAFLPEILRVMQGQLQAAQLENLTQLLQTHNRFFPPSSESLERLTFEVESVKGKQGTNSKVKIAIERVLAGVRLLSQVANPEIVETNMQDVKLLLSEKVLSETLQRIITNSSRQDLHFLPFDEQPIEWSGVVSHSVALFRYAFSAPVELFECAQDINLADWQATVEKLASLIPGALAFKDERPLKRSTLKPRFLADLLTRYVGMHVRLGSPDFSTQAIAEYSNQIGGC